MIMQYTSQAYYKVLVIINERNLNETPIEISTKEYKPFQWRLFSCIKFIRMQQLLGECLMYIQAWNWSNFFH